MLPPATLTAQTPRFIESGYNESASMMSTLYRAAFFTATKRKS